MSVILVFVWSTILFTFFFVDLALSLNRKVSILCCIKYKIYGYLVQDMKYMPLFLLRYYIASLPIGMFLIHLGTLCYMSGSIQMDNNYLPENEGGVWQWLFGKSLTSIVFFNPGPEDGYVGIAAPSPARILPVGR